jgi:hypothetical protein
MELSIEIAGVLMIGLAALHAFFPRRFGWKTEFATIGLLSRQMMYVHTFFIALTILLMGVLCLTSAGDLVATPLGRRISLGLAFFWFARLVIQFFGYSSELWRGKRFETAMHLAFSVFWVYLTTVFAVVAVSG